MGETLEVLTAALNLSRTDRSYVADRLLESLENEQELSPEWQEELARRVARHERGESRIYSREEIRQQVQERLS